MFQQDLTVSRHPSYPAAEPTWCLSPQKQPGNGSNKKRLRRDSGCERGGNRRGSSAARESLAKRLLCGVWQGIRQFRLEAAGCSPSQRRTSMAITVIARAHRHRCDRRLQAMAPRTYTDRDRPRPRPLSPRLLSPPPDLSPARARPRTFSTPPGIGPARSLHGPRSPLPDISPARPRPHSPVRSPSRPTSLALALAGTLPRPLASNCHAEYVLRIAISPDLLLAGSAC